MKKTLCFIVTILVIMMLTSGLNAKTFELKFSTAVTPNDPWGKLATTLIDHINKNTNGTVIVTPYWSNKLGTGNDVIKQVARGRIDMGGFQITDAESVVNEIALIGTPFLFDSDQQRDCVMDDHVAPLLADLFEKKGLKMIQYLYGGSVGVGSKMPILNPADVKDIKIRSNQSNYSILLWESAGASTVPLPFTEFASSLQTGLVKGGPIGAIWYVYYGFNKLAPHFTFLKQWYNTGFILMSMKIWKQLSAEQQEQIMKSKVPLDGFRDQIRGMEMMLLKKHQEEGGFVHDLTPEQRQQWRDAVAPKYQEFVKSVKGDSQKLWKILQDGKASCGR